MASAEEVPHEKDTFFGSVPDAPLKEYIAREGTIIFSVHKHHASWRVARHMYGFEFCISKADDVSIAKVMADGRLLLVVTEPEHAALCGGLCQPEFILLTGFGLDAILFEEERIAEDVVEVQVGVQHPFQGQSVARQVVLEELLFFLVETTRVDYNRFARLIGENVAVHGEHVEFELLYFHFTIFFR